MESNDVFLVTTCTNRKRVIVPEKLRAASLNRGSQAEVLQQWLTRLSRYPHVGMASDVYCGRAFKEAYQAKIEASAPLWIISAGLGLLAEDTMIPAYSLTSAGANPDNVAKKITVERFIPSEWWKGINRSPKPLCHLILDHPDSIFIIALSQAYAVLVQKDLLTLPDEGLRRVRLVGLAITPVLDPRLHKVVMPYDERLDGPDASNVGTRSDFAQRAMRHFAPTVLRDAKNRGPDHHARLITQSLAGLRHPHVPRRTRLSDDKIMEVILKHWPSSGNNSSRMLRILRDEERIACEQGRFQKLFQHAKKRFHHEFN